MKKIGIITLNGESNYGNRLQAYALQRAVVELGAHPETIVPVSSLDTVKKRTKYTIGRLPLPHARIAYWRMLAEKEKVFAPFSKEYIRTRRVSDDLSIIADDYDVFITGSDQVWNPDRVKGSSVNLLGFAPAEKRASYAASFGVTEIPEDKRQLYADHLSKFRYLSVREERGVELVDQLVSKKAKLVVDPTMLVPKQEWSELCRGYEHLAEEKYIVVYTLRPLAKDVETSIQQYAKDQGLSVYRIMGDLYDKGHHIPDPAEFIARIKYAAAVLTDSFHASVFSIIMHTPFVAFRRADSKMESRLQTLVDRFHLPGAMYQDGLSVADSIERQDFTEVDAILGQGRREGFVYLSRVLKGE